jgi:putative ABC transport system permease protein
LFAWLTISDMIRNYIKIALRNILKHKFFSAINITGLVTGVTCCLLIFVYVVDELSYDRFHKGYENIYRIVLHGRISGQEILGATSSVPVGPAIKAEIPGVEDVMRLFPTYGGLAVRYGDNSFTEDKIFYADSNFFEFFSFRLTQGDAATVLKEPNAIVITRSLARKYFGDEDPIGKILTIGVSKLACKVTGVCEDTPTNSHLQFSAIISFITSEKDYFPGWTGNSIQTYVRKTPATRVADIDKKLEDLVEKYVGKELQEGLGISFEQFRKQGGIYSYYLMPLADSHLRSGLSDDLEPPGDIRYVYIFSGVGLFILLIACINFMNLATAQSAGRAKEVGLRKTLGSQRSQMVWQFLSESFIYSFVAVVLSVGVSFLVLPYFNLLAGKQLTLAALTQPGIIMAALGLIIVVGLVAGSYPAFYLTSFNVVEVLKGKVRAGVKSKGVRSSLVVFQFAVSTFLIIATGVVYQQLSYMQNRNLGLDKKNVISIAGARRLANNRDAFKTAVQGLAGVEKASYTDNTFPGMNNITVFREKGKEVDHLVGKYNADWDHLEVMKMELKQGRFFSRDFKTDTVAAVINEAAIKEFGFQNPVNSELVDYNGQKPEVVKIIGVVGNFNFESLKATVRPVIIRLTEKSRILMVRYTGDPRQVLSSIEQQWKSLAPGEPFEYTFLDENYDKLFRSEMRLRDIFTVFSSLTIFIACLGLFALAAFTTEQRTKEIGVRKAMGATVMSLTVLLSKEFTRLVLIAILPAVGFGWYVANWWLSDFVYRIKLSPVLFVGSALAAIFIAWITVSYQSIKAAASNPVNSLRYE